MTLPGVDLIPRDVILCQHPYLAQEIGAWQRANAPDEDDEDREWYASECDDIVPDPSIRWVGNLILYLPTDDLEETARGVGPALGRMAEALGQRRLALLNAWRAGNWITPRTDPSVLAAAADAFRAMGADDAFNGGIEVGAAEAGTVLEPLLWCVRMDAGFGSIYITAGDAPFTATLCQYANLHVEVYSAQEMERIRGAARSAGFAEWTNGMCDERFAAGGAIPGRELRT